MEVIMFQIIIKEFKEFLRDKTNLFFFLLFPVVLVFLLGNLLTSMDKADEVIGEIKAQYIVQTEDQRANIAIESFVKAIGDDSLLVLEKANDLETSKKLVGTDKLTAVVVFRGYPLEINIYEGSNQIKNRTVSAIMNSFVLTNKSISSVMKIAPAVILSGTSGNGEYVKQKDLGVNRSMIDYYAVSMLAMISFMSVMVGAGAFVGERQNKTINRLIIAPQNRVQLFLQKILGMVPQVIIQIMVIMLISVFVFKAHYAATFTENLYLFFFFFVITLAMVSFGAVVGLLIKANPMALLMPFLWLMMFFGGTYSKEVNIKGLTQAMPIYQIQQAAFDLAIFGRYHKVNTIILIAGIIIIIMLTTGALLFYKKQEER